MWFDLKGDARLGRCATECCGQQPQFRLEAGGVGSNFCSACRAKIEDVQAMQRMLADMTARKDGMLSYYEKVTGLSGIQGEQ